MLSPRGLPLIVAALLALGGCGEQPQPVSVENGAEALSANLEQMANELEAAAAAQVNATEQATLSDAAASFDNASDEASDGLNVSDNAANP